MNNDDMHRPTRDAKESGERIQALRERARKTPVFGAKAMRELQALLTKRTEDIEIQNGYDLQSQVIAVVAPRLVASLEAHRHDERPMLTYPAVMQLADRVYEDYLREDKESGGTPLTGVEHDTIHYAFRQIVKDCCKDVVQARQNSSSRGV